MLNPPVEAVPKMMNIAVRHEREQPAQKSTQYLGELKTLLDGVNAEDQVGVENVYCGLKSDFAQGRASLLSGTTKL